MWRWPWGERSGRGTLKKNPDITLAYPLSRTPPPYPQNVDKKRVFFVNPSLMDLRIEDCLKKRFSVFIKNNYFFERSSPQVSLASMDIHPSGILDLQPSGILNDV